MIEVTDSTDIAALKAEVERLRQVVQDLTQRVAHAESLADHDVLTPVLNRRGFMGQVRRAMAYARRHGIATTLVYLDMDGFKRINDDLGHAAGDAALIRVAQILLGNVRGSDAVGRLGGDEFALVLLNAGQAEGEAKAEQMLARLRAEPFAYEGQGALLTGSFGVSQLLDHQDADQWLADADAAMWRSKRQGRSGRT